MAQNGTDNNKISPQQHQAIAALLSTKSVPEAANQAKMATRTLYRWLGEPNFKAALAVAEGELISAATRRLLQHQDTALTVILTLMADKQYPASVRLRAATAIIDYMLKLREMRSVEERLSALEEAIAKPK